MMMLVLLSRYLLTRLVVFGLFHLYCLFLQLTFFMLCREYIFKTGFLDGCEWLLLSLPLGCTRILIVFIWIVNVSNSLKPYYVVHVLVLPLMFLFSIVLFVRLPLLFLAFKIIICHKSFLKIELLVLNIFLRLMVNLTIMSARLRQCNAPWWSYPCWLFWQFNIILYNARTKTTITWLTFKIRDIEIFSTHGYIIKGSYLVHKNFSVFTCFSYESLIFYKND